MKENNHTDGKRNLGIDLLRMVCMFMIVMLHTLGHGGILGASQMGTSNYAASWFWEIAALCAVNCYALISGYVGCTSKFKYSNIVVLWLQVAFYSVLDTVLIALYYPNVDGMIELELSFYPVTNQRYWYFTAYFAMYFFIPFLNYLINNLEKKMLQRLTISLVLVFSILPTYAEADIFKLYDGYSAFWLMTMYIIGGYVKKYGIMINLSKIKLMLVYLSQILLTWGWKIGNENVLFEIKGEMETPDKFIRYTSPTLVVAAIALLVLFMKIDIKRFFGKIVKFMAPMAFSVYLIHDNPLVRMNVMYGRFSEYATYETWKLFLLIPCTALIIYLICSFADLFRVGLFKLLNIKKNIEKLEQKIVEKFANNN